MDTMEPTLMIPFEEISALDVPVEARLSLYAVAVAKAHARAAMRVCAWALGPESWELPQESATHTPYSPIYPDAACYMGNAGFMADVRYCLSALVDAYRVRGDSAVLDLAGSFDALPD